MKDFGSITNSFCLTKGDVANCGKVRFRGEDPPISGPPSIPYPAHFALPRQQENS